MIYHDAHALRQEFILSLDDREGVGTGLVHRSRLLGVNSDIFPVHVDQINLADLVRIVGLDDIDLADNDRRLIVEIDPFHGRTAERGPGRAHVATFRRVWRSRRLQGSPAWVAVLRTGLGLNCPLPDRFNDSYFRLIEFHAPQYRLKGGDKGFPALVRARPDDHDAPIIHIDDDDAAGESGLVHGPAEINIGGVGLSHADLLCLAHYLKARAPLVILDEEIDHFNGVLSSGRPSTRDHILRPGLDDDQGDRWRCAFLHTLYGLHTLKKEDPIILSQEIPAGRVADRVTVLLVVVRLRFQLQGGWGDRGRGRRGCRGGRNGRCGCRGWNGGRGRGWRRRGRRRRRRGGRLLAPTGDDKQS